MRSYWESISPVPRRCRAGTFSDIALLDRPIVYLDVPKLLAKAMEKNPSMDLVREVDRFVKGQGKVLVVGFLDPDPAMTRACEGEGILVADLTRADRRLRFPSHGRHVTETGHELVSQLLYEFLLAKRLVPD